MTQEGPSLDPTAAAPARDEFEFPQATLDSVTQLIVAAQNGEPGAWDRVYTLLYKDLHEAAALQIRRRWRRGCGGSRSAWQSPNSACCRARSPCCCASGATATR